MVRSSWYVSGRLPRMSSRRLILAKAGIRISRMRLLRLGFLRGRFLSYTMFCLAELLFDFSDFVGFDVSWSRAPPFRQRLFPFGGSLFGAAKFGINVA